MNNDTFLHSVREYTSFDEAMVAYLVSIAEVLDADERQKLIDDLLPIHQELEQTTSDVINAYKKIEEKLHQYRSKEFPKVRTAVEKIDDKHKSSTLETMFDDVSL